MKNQNNLKNNSTDINQQVVELLKEKPGLKAWEIATYLDFDKKTINKALYGYLKDECIQDEKYCWYLSKNAPMKNDNKKTEISRTVLSNLCRYYLACLAQDDEGGINVFADSMDYVELDSLPSFNDNRLFKSVDAQNLFSKIRKDRSRLEMYFAYPTFLRKIDNQERMAVEPVLLFRIDIENGCPTLNKDFPFFNFSVIKNFTNAEREQLMNELVQLEEELNLNSEDAIPELDDLVKKLSTIRPEWPWKEEIDPDELKTDIPLKKITEEGIYNRAILIIGERSPFTQGLETELKSLSEIQPDMYKDTVLGQWISGNISKKEVTDNLLLLEVLPLNFEQRQAIQSSLKNPLTIITGPPGTGKSQVVTNLLINAVWQGKKVLFASKNNKAVDVVDIRVNNLGNRPVLLRMGSGQYHAKLAEYLMGLLTSVSSEADQEEFDLDKQRYKKLEEKFVELDREENELVRLRNETDELDQAVEKIRIDISPEIFERLRNIDQQEFQKNIDVIKRAIKRTNKDTQGFLVGLFWSFIKKGRYEKLRDKIEDFKYFASNIELDLPVVKLEDYNNKEITEFSKKLDLYLYFTQTIQEYFSSLKYLQEAKSLEKISIEKNLLMKDMAANAENLWRGWLKLQSAKLSDEDRVLLSNYNTLLKMVIDAGADLYTKLSKKIYREYSNLSKKVSHLLPAWAITSLSARGRIPFEAGYFDIVIFDEAGQCDIASALPLLYRAKQAVIIGDNMQLRHISNLNIQQSMQLMEKNSLLSNYVNWEYSEKSLFSLAYDLGLVTKNNIIKLKDHHRSHSEIIEFSNQEFYDGSLRVATNYDSLKFLESEKNGVRWVNVVGNVKRPSTGGAINEIEAKVVVGEIENIINEKKYKGTIGVVTPFRAQANLIRKLINDNYNLQEKLIKHDFIVDVVHKFQGDERDIMIFSLVISKGMPEGAFWFMGNKNGENLFNVAITRARAMLLVVGDYSAAINCKISYLENFARYTQQLESDKNKKVSYAVQDLGGEYPVVTHPERVSEWEHIFYRALYGAGIKVIPQYQVEKYTLDFAMFKEDRQLNIEVDGERYHKNWTGELCRRDQIRNQRLFELGWDVKRFWVYEIRDDIDGCIEKIKRWIEKD